MNNNDYSACTSILVGRKATTDGSTLIGRNEDSKSAWPKRFIVHAHKEFDDKQQFNSKDNNFKIELPQIRAKYTATPEWTDKFGIFEEDGINEHGVAMSATESTYANNQVLGYDPLVKDGIAEEAMVTVILPYIKNARDGVKRLGKIIDNYGAAETNGILFSDEKEVWYFEIGSGHQWVAQRIPDDEYAIVANQMAIQEINFSEKNNFMWSPNIKEFVKNNNLNPNEHGFNFREIFGTHDLSDTYYNTPRVWYGQKIFNPSIEQVTSSQKMPLTRKPEQLISTFDAQSFLSSHYQGTCYDPIGNGSQADKTKFRPVSLAKTQESHVLQLTDKLPKEIGNIHWLLMGVGAQSTYVPFFSGLTDVPEEYKYDVKQNFDDKSAYWIFKLVGVLVDPHYAMYNKALQDTQDNLIQQYIQIINETNKQANGLEASALNKLATKQSFKAANLAMQSFKNLAAQLITKSTDFSKLNFKQDLNL